MPSKEDKPEECGGRHLDDGVQEGHIMSDDIW